MDLQERLDAALPTIREHADDVDERACFPTESVDALGSAGLLGLTVPEAHGGLGAGPAGFVQAIEAVASACGSTSMVYLMHLSAANVVAAAPPTGRTDLLPALASGEVLGTLAFSESGSRSHFWAPVSRAERLGATLRITADKSWVTSARHVDVWVTTTATAGSDDPMASDLYVVDRTAPGVTVTGSFDGLGLRGNDSAPARVAVELSDGDRLGDEGGGFPLMMQVVLPWFSLGNSAVSDGLAAAALERAISHASAARLQHLDSSLADLPTIRAYVAKAWADLAAHRALLEQTAAWVAEPDEGTVLAVLATKATCNEAALRITEAALRVCGGAGFSKQVGVDRPYRDARAGFVMAPTSDALYDFAGRALCGMELF